jgi:hypothetical protein
MRRAGVLGLAITIASATVACAEPRKIMGAGTISCAEWQQYRSYEQNGNEQYQVNAYQAQALIDGFLSGYNTAIVGPDILASGLGGRASYAWIDNYCRSKPLDLLINATWTLCRNCSRERGNDRAGSHGVST